MEPKDDKTIIEMENYVKDQFQENGDSEKLTRKQKCVKTLKKNILLVMLIVSMGAGIGLGAGLRMVNPPFSTRQILYLSFPGELLMNMLKLLILPLVVSSLISGLASLDARASGKMGLRAVIYYLTTTLAAVVLGIVLTVSIRPGSRGGEPDKTGEAKVVHTADTFLDLLRQAFPDNLVEACFSKPLTDQVKKIVNVTTTVYDLNDNTTTDSLNFTGSTGNTTNENGTLNVVQDIMYDPEIIKSPGMNVLGLVMFSIFFGVIIGRMGDRGKPLADFFESLSEAVMQLIRLVIWYSPIGIMFLIAAKVVEMENPERTFQQLLYYFVTVICGLVAHGFITLPLIYLVIVRKNPFRFIYGVTQAIVTALGTSSSSATLPITMRCLEENNGVDSRVTKFVAPVGATINMDGTALYEAVAVLFIGQVRGFDLTLGQVITVSITSTAAAIGAAGVPQAGLVTMVIVLTAVGFPTDDVTLVIAIDWLLDRFRTAVNVLGDAIGAGIVHHLSKKELDKIDEKGPAENGDLLPNGHINEGFTDYRL